MSTDLQPRVESVLNPTTGEILDLDSPSDELGRWLLEAREWERRLREAKNAVVEELHRRMDAEASWTIHTPDFDLRGESPDRVEYDPERLRSTLAGLAKAGAISEGAAEAALKEEVTYKPRCQGINALLKLGGEVAEQVELCRIPVERARRVSIVSKR